MRQVFTSILTLYVDVVVASKDSTNTRDEEKGKGVYKVTGCVSLHAC